LWVQRRCKASQQKKHSAQTPPSSWKFPWDALQAYYFRARRSVMLVPEASRLAWLEERDTLERTVWASQFRESYRSLGQVVQSVMGDVKDHWDTQSQGMAGRASPAFPPQPISAKARQRRNLWARLCQNARQPPPPTKAIESTLMRRSNERQIARQLSRQQQYQAQTAAAPQNEGEGTTWPSQFRESHISLGQVAQSVMNESGNGWHTPIQSDVARAVPAPSPQPRVKPRAPSMRRMMINMQEWLAKRIAAADSRAQTKNRAVKTPGASASSSRDGLTAGPDLIGENERIHFTLHHVPL
jgi:hypothetical protein